MNYGEVLSRAWQIVWRHKALWIFGILAGCGSTGGGGGQGNISYSLSGAEELPTWLQNLILRFVHMSDAQWILLLVGLALLFLLIIVVVIFLSTMGRIGLYRGVQLADGGQERLPFGELFRGGLPYFWRVFFLNLLIGLAIFFLLLLLLGAGIAGTVVTFGLIWLCLLPLFCLVIPLGWLVSIWIEQVNLAIVLENLSISAALKRGWQVFRDNLGPMILMGLILILGVGLIGGMVLALPLFVISVPAMIGLAAGRQDWGIGGLAVAGLCLVLYLPVLILLSGILRSYIESAWTLTYLRLTGGPAANELMVEATS